MTFVFVSNASEVCSSLISRKNVWMLRQKAYEEVLNYGKYFDVAIIP